MRTSDMIKSKFFGGRDLAGQRPLVLTIAHVTEELFSRGSAPEMQYFLWFTDHQKGLKLNKTRVTVLERAYGPDSDLWTGHKVRLSFDPTVKFGAVAVGSIVVETPPGVVYAGAPVAAPGWSSAPTGAAAPPSAPPPPVWDAQAGVWRTQNPIAAPAPPPAVPPPPVWNAATGQWEVVNPGTGEIARPGAAAPVSVPGPRVPEPQPGTWGGAPTISQRVAPGADATGGWGEDDPEFGHPDIPF